MTADLLALPPQQLWELADNGDFVPALDEFDPILSDGAAWRRQILAQLPAAQAECRVYGHTWPRLRVNKVAPVNLMYVPVDGRPGYYQMVQLCGNNCGLRRWRDTVKDGRWDPWARWHRIEPSDWVRIPRDSGVVKWMIVAAQYDQSAAAAVAARMVRPEAN